MFLNGFSNGFHLNAGCFKALSPNVVAKYLPIGLLPTTSMKDDVHRWLDGFFTVNGVSHV